MKEVPKRLAPESVNSSQVVSVFREPLRVSELRPANDE